MLVHDDREEVTRASLIVKIRPSHLPPRITSLMLLRRPSRSRKRRLHLVRLAQSVRAGVRGLEGALCSQFPHGASRLQDVLTCDTALAVFLSVLDNGVDTRARDVESRGCL